MRQRAYEVDFGVTRLAPKENEVDLGATCFALREGVEEISFRATCFTLNESQLLSQLWSNKLCSGAELNLVPPCLT